LLSDPFGAAKGLGRLPGKLRYVLLGETQLSRDGGVGANFTRRLPNGAYRKDNNLAHARAKRRGFRFRELKI
jgi:hypothetical protein